MELAQRIDDYGKPAWIGLMVLSAGTLGLVDPGTRGAAR